MIKTYDAIIIGTGQARPFQAQRLASARIGACILRTGGDKAMHSTISELIPTMPGELQLVSDSADVPG